MDNIRILLDYIQTANLLPSSELHHLNNIVNNNNFALPIILQEHVIFIYDDNKNHQIIKITGDFNQWQTNFDMENLEGTTLYYKIFKFPSDSRFDYRFIIENEWIIDPNNHHLSHGGFGHNSEIKMPNFKENVYLNYVHTNNHGTIIYHLIQSNITNQEYKIKVYTPVGYVKNNNYPVLIFHDGFEHIDYSKANNQIDNLINENKIIPPLAIFIKPYDRNKEYAEENRELYTKFFLEELIPFLEYNYNLNNSTVYHVFASDLGANISLYIAHNSSKFKNFYFQSPQVWPNNFEVLNLIKPLANDIEIKILYGSYEISKDNNYEKFFNLLHELNIKHDITSYPLGHGWGLWKNTLYQLLIKALDKSCLANPSDCKLFVNYNEESNEAEIEYILNSTYEVSINLFNLMGNLLLPIFNGIKDKGKHKITIKFNELPKATYIVSMKIQNKTFIQKITL